MTLSNAYTVASNGALTTVPGGYEIPSKTQGVAVTASRFIVSTSYGRTNRGNLYVVFESGSYEYRAGARNPITRLHKAATSSLVPVASSAHTRLPVGHLSTNMRMDHVPVYPVWRRWAVRANPLPDGTVGRVTVSVDLNEPAKPVIYLDGEIDIQAAAEVRAAGHKAVAVATGGTVTIDLGGVTFLDSTGLGALAGVRATAVAADKTLVLRAVPERAAYVLALTGMDRIFTVED
jgi:anti-anti-sigma factor